MWKSSSRSRFPHRFKHNKELHHGSVTTEAHRRRQGAAISTSARLQLRPQGQDRAVVTTHKPLASP
ncbi:hypothetical protein C2845_PM07G16590 [Panicum miliaceum]|uniref:Uncharacterized protein n=1 Tax=Panicum miliaceum TaxID=4540 RepID=A0A3L6SK13_PANMI|nr:hypothetical protein C2845_PM07G16590 [Panicum miliaceum]